MVEEIQKLRWFKNQYTIFNDKLIKNKIVKAKVN